MQKYGKPQPSSLLTTQFQQQILASDLKGEIQQSPKYDEESIWKLLNHVKDPEIPTVSVVDLGIVRRVDIQMPNIYLDVTPTYSGCPATDLINEQILDTLTFAGYHSVYIKQVLSPAWTTDFITSEGRKKLKAFGIAPPKAVSKFSLVDRNVSCPHCGSVSTHLLSEFGSTACKALYQCHSCREAFDYFKCI